MPMSLGFAGGLRRRLSSPGRRNTTTVQISFRIGFYAGLIAAIALGAYLIQLWQPERQVELHTASLLKAIEQKDWPTIGKLIDPAYADQWHHDRALLLARLRAILQYTRNLHLTTHEPLVVATESGPEWMARITVAAEENELTAMIKGRVNPLKEPFRLQWRQQSWKPWDWKLVGASNEALDLPESADF